MTEHHLVGLASIFIFGISAQWLAWRIKMPSILLLLLFGFIAGPILDLLHPDELFGEMLIPLVSIFVAIILFEGGMSLRFSDLQGLRHVVWSLISVGAFVTWVLSSVAAYYLLGLDLNLAILLGGILVVTGPTVIIPLLRHVRPVPRLASTLRWEGILIDPIGALLAVLIYEVIVAAGVNEASWTIGMALLKTIVLGTLIGLFAAGFLYICFRNFWVPDFLHNSLSLMAVIAVFTLSNLLQTESGLLAVTVMGIALANQKKVTIRHVVVFKEDLSILLISSIFILLAARIDPVELKSVILSSIPFLFVLIFIVRPLAVFLSTIRSDFSWNEKAFLAWMAPRGIVAAAVASIFALRMSQAGYEQAELLVPYTFVVIIGTVMIYGLSARYVAERLQVAQPAPQGALIMGAHDWARKIAHSLQEEGLNVLLVDTNRRNVYEAKMEGLPAHYGNIFSEYLLLDGIGYLLAMTSNDEGNALATVNYIELFGRSGVYQLPPVYGEKETKGGLTPPHLRGRFLFGKEITYYFLEEHFRAGATIKKTRLTQEFSFEDLKSKYGQSALPLFLINGNKKLQIFNTDNPPTPHAGQTIISLIEPGEYEHKVEKKKQEKQEKAEKQENAGKKEPV